MPSFDSPLAAFLHWESTTPNDTFLRQPLNGDIKEYTYKESGDEIRKAATGLKALDMPENSKVALISKNCAHWIMADLAIMMAGHISVPLYPTLGPDTIKLVLEHSESKAIFIGKLDNYEVQKSGIPNIHKIGVEAYGINEDISWEGIISKNEPLTDLAALAPDDLLTIIYTSGTTGMPKGVMHTVSNISQVVNNAEVVIPLPDRPKFFSFLPLSHVAERIAVGYHGLYRHGVFSFPESLESFASDLAATQPHMFFAVPRIWAKFQEAILNKMPQKKLDRLLGIPIIGGIVKKKIVKKLGLSEATYMTTGAAPIAVSMLEWYDKLGITIHQAYGMTEDCILSHYNLVGANKMGTVGQALPGVTAKLTAEGEICIKSDVLMKGYYKEPKLTAEMFDEEGYLKTGDIGEYDHDGYLTITGRVKDQFKTDKGKYIAPAPIELELLKNPDIEQVCIVGMGIPQPIALVIKSLVANDKSKEDLSSSIENSVKKLNSSLASHERIEKIVVMMEDWTIDNGLMTPTLKIKRNQIEKIHMPMYSSWFDSDEKVIYES
ncbi:MAG: AMP-binding protein [Cyclobacteriaceae bacterium]|nr:AMP-binding protein [Cyclobacteriaceae bacterium]